MTQLDEMFRQLGLSQYLAAFEEEGFDSWDIVLDITEADLYAQSPFQVKLQRAIAVSRGQSLELALPGIVRNPSPPEETYQTDESGDETKHKLSEPRPATATGKRKYRRHPKVRSSTRSCLYFVYELCSPKAQPDENGPERPPSAYVIFSNRMREVLKGQDLSFTDIAKLVGERWQDLAPDAKEPCERQAQAAKERYYAALAEYKKTPEYARYQAYLADFKLKHAGLSDGKRTKAEPETSISVRSSSNENTEKGYPQDRNTQWVNAQQARARLRSGSSPRVIHQRSNSTQYYHNPTSATRQSNSTINSPITNGSPISTSPIMPLFSTGRDRQAETAGQHTLPIHSAYGAFAPGNVSMPSPLNNSATYQTRGDQLSRRSVQDTHSLPSLMHEDTSLSSDSSGRSAAGPFQGYVLPVLDPSKTSSSRHLPLPTPTPGAIPTTLEPRPSAQPYQYESRVPSSLAALLRAGELARNAESSGKTAENGRLPSDCAADVVRAARLS
ncbi:hypothetical protein LTR50_005565 [Elasticomyces elasticus]|nr:hypothetical protein LTR50_005565 [Elasticomyces elasticus]